MILGLQSFKGLYQKETNELEAICSLSESHSPGLRFKTVLRYEKLLSEENDVNKISPQLSSKDVLQIKCPLEPMENKVKQMLRYIEEMPKGK